MSKRGKSKEFISSGEDSASGSGEDRPVKKQKTKQKETAKKPAAASGEDAARGGQEEDELMQLSKMRFVSVSNFKGRPLVNIREYYDKDGKLLPGRKGISLSVDQWQRLKECMDDIDKRVRKII